MMELTDRIAKVLHGIMLLIIFTVVGTVTGETSVCKGINHNAENTISHVQKAYGKLPLSFEVNQGQASENVRFLTRGSGHTMLLSSRELTLALLQPQFQTEREDSGNTKAIKPKKNKTTMLRMQLVGANPEPEVLGLDELPGKSNYLIGRNPRQWHANIPTYARVSYREVYPGVDWVLYGNQQQLEYDFIVAPGIDPGIIKLCFKGADNLEIDDQGNLILHMSGGEVIQHAPVIYQVTEGVRKRISGGYVLNPKSEIPNRKSQIPNPKSEMVGFDIAAYDVNKPLIIDPVLSYSTVIGGNRSTSGNDIAVDSSGIAYITGITSSVDLHVENAFQGALAGLVDAFVSKFNAAGTALVYCTYLGGNGFDQGLAIAVDDSGNACVTGETNSSNFPVASPIQGVLGGFRDAFITKLNAAGNDLVYSTYLGGIRYESGVDIAIDKSGNAYITGITNSLNFPTKNPIQGSLAGLKDAFVTKLNPTGTSLIFSTYFGGRRNDHSLAIAVDQPGNVYVTGKTNSFNFPTVNPSQTFLRGLDDVFVTKLNESGDDIVYSTYLGGRKSDSGNGIAVDTIGNAYVTGNTDSSNFPIKDPFQGVLGGLKDAFVTKLNAAGDDIVYSTYLGGMKSDSGNGIAVDTNGNAYVTGETDSLNFPTGDPFQDVSGGLKDAFVTKLNTAGDDIVYSTYLGGRISDSCNGIAVDTIGNAYVTGETNSFNFPVVNPFRGESVGKTEAFVAKISNTTMPVAIPVTTPVITLNNPPVLFPIGNKTVKAGELLEFIVTATDPEEDELNYSASNLPIGASFDQLTQEFSWTPGATQVGNFPDILFTVTDNGDPPASDTEFITIAVINADIIDAIGDDSGNVNHPPVLATIGNKTVNVSELLEFTITATDPDGDELSYSASNLPSGARFNTFTQVFKWTPDISKSGDFTNVLFTVTDNGDPIASDSESITITVINEAIGQINSPPVLTPIGNKTVKAGELLAFTITATDPDVDELSYSASNLPSGANFDQVTQKFSWTPGSAQAGDFTDIIFSVIDSGEPRASDSESITITVINEALSDVNSPPVLARIGNKVVNQGELLEFTVTATDPDGDKLSYSVSNLPIAARFNRFTQVFKWTPDIIQSGNFTDIIFTVTDNGKPPASDSESITITVNDPLEDVNLPPVLARIGSKSVKAGELLEFTVIATDQDGDELAYSASNLPSGASFDPVAQLFSWTPEATEIGNFTDIIFTVTDNGKPPASDSESITITVINDALGNVNSPPVLAPIGNKTVKASELLEFTITATDPDGDELSYSAGSLPGGAVFDPITQVFSWAPDITQIGNFTDIVFTVTDNGEPIASDSESITITVNDNTGDVNRPPVLAPIGNKTVKAGKLLEFTITATDPDGDELSYSAGSLPGGAVFDPITQVFSWAPDITQIGNFTDIVFTVTDNGEPIASDSESITITVNDTIGDVNRLPVLSPIGNKAVNAGELLEFTVTATDPDGDNLNYSASNLPDGSDFNPVGQVFSWTPEVTQVGNFTDVVFTVTDSGEPPETDSESITITVNETIGNVNSPPVLAPIGNKAVNAGELLEFTITATDPDGDELSYSAGNLPAGAVFDPVTQVFSWTPGSSQIGSFTNVLFTVTDSGTPPASGSESITITVNSAVVSVNNPPVLDAIGSKTVNAGELLEFTITATDPDGDELIYSASNLPAVAVFDPLTQVFSWMPGSSQVGSFTNVLFTVTDSGTPPASDSESITITVNSAVVSVNNPPVLDAIGSKTVNEGELLEFTITATDPDGDELIYSASNLPAGAVFDPVTQVFSWMPGSSQVGSFTNVLFTVTDSGTPPASDSESITITVNSVAVSINNPPVLDAIGSKTVNEGELLEFTITATDPDRDELIYSASNLPAGAVFDPVAQVFSWMPGSSQVGSFTNVLFTVTDSGTPPASDSESITITVNSAVVSVNNPPVLDAIGNKTINEGELLEFTITATDPDGDELIYSASNLPAGAVFDPVTQVFSWMPGSSQVGSFTNVLFTVTDSGTPPASDSESITITVNSVAVSINNPPVLDAIGNKTINEGELLEFTITATDPDGDDLIYSASNLPAGASFDPVTQVFSWIPDFSQMGIHPNIHFEVTDGNLVDSEEITIMVDVVLPVVLSIDIMPNECPNLLNINSGGDFEVAILGTPDFDVRMIDISTLRLNGVAPVENEFKDETAPALKSDICDCEELDEDNFEDLVLEFEIEAIVSTLGEVNDGDKILLTISGNLLDSEGMLTISGSDCVKIKD